MRLPRTASGTAGAITAMPAARIAPAAQQTIHATSPADRVPTAAPLHRQPETDPGSGLLARVQAPFRDWLPEAAQDHLFDAPIGAAPSAGDPSTNLWAAIATVTAANSAVEGAAGASFHEPDADLPTSRTPLESLADGVAALLHDEADLRGIDR